ncbi:MAG: WbqC family protein [Flavobacteriales bacterium]|nr:WbqC family protein [Flavobacteriales bacterium]MBP9080250.1 WbqC family protein [Flavobacteriales bacterium]
MSTTLLFPAFYFGSVEHYALIARSTRLVIDLGEHYERQSYRTRTGIVGANGRQDLQVHIARRSGAKMPMGTVGLSYTEPWHHQHVQAIRSAYGMAPWYIHYIDELEGLLGQKYDRLVDLDLATLRMVLRWLRLDRAIIVEEHYVEPATAAAEHLWDLRTTLHPKRALPPGTPSVVPYPQVFTDRHGFHGRLSILDLLMNLGPEALQALLRM